MNVHDAVLPRQSSSPAVADGVVVGGAVVVEGGAVVVVADNVGICADDGDPVDVTPDGPVELDDIDVDGGDPVEDIAGDVVLLLVENFVDDIIGERIPPSSHWNSGVESQAASESRTSK